MTVPIRSWSRRVPRGVPEQLERIASQPYVVEHVASMPDAHVAEGVAVGTVFATTDTLVPSALGGDLGCGMSAVHFPFPAAALSQAELSALISRWTEEIPTGDQGHARAAVRKVPDTLYGLSTGSLERVRERVGPRHLGTLGGGNHFLELDRDAGGDLWLLVHSGSRGLGSAIAAHHCRAAELLGHGSIPGLALDSAAGQACAADLRLAFEFAKWNRNELRRLAERRLIELIGVEPDDAIDLHHNFVAREEHFGRPLWVHRKGAIRAAAGERGLIPGSMGSASWLVEGLGEESSFRSASHGAGRVLTRREARDRIDPHRFVHSMRRVVFDARKARSLVEEAAAAYRDLGEVLEDEVDLVRPVLRLEPIAVLKG